MATFSLGSHMIFLLCVHICVQLFSSFKDTSHIGVPTIINSFNPNYFFKSPFFLYAFPLVRCWELGLQHMDLSETQFSP